MEWGPELWAGFHNLAKSSVYNKIEGLENYWKILPCDGCSDHFKNLVEQYPPPQGETYEWSVMIHNEVNKLLGKPEFIQTPVLQST